MDNFYILIPEKITPCIEHIKSQLAYYIKEATSVILPSYSSIKNSSLNKNCHYLSLGQTDGVSRECYQYYCSRTENDGFSIVPQNGNLFFIAKTERELCYAVYHYLESCYGIRFLTADCEYIPKSENIVIPKNEIISESQFKMRTYLTADIFQERANLDFVVKTRTNDVFTKLPEKYGGENNVFGRNDNHNFRFYVPFEVYGNDHPEFYRFFYTNNEIYHTIDLTNGITEDGKLDESKETSVAKIVIEELKKDIINNPDKEIFNFTQEDGNFYYQSENNTRLENKYKRSGILIRFCNVVIRKLNEFCQKELNGRKVKLVTFAYLYTKDAPVKEENGQIVPIDKTCVADENLIIQLAIFTNGYYSFLSENQWESVRKSFKEWKKIGHEFWYWGYDIDFHRYLAFYHSFNVIKQNIMEMKDYGITYLCINGPYESHYNWQANIRAYAYRKLMWDSSLSPDDLINEFIDLYYGSGKTAVKEVISKFEDHFEIKEKSGYNLEFTTWCNGSECQNVPLSLLNSCINIIKEAENQSDSSEIVQHLQQIRFSFEFFIYDNRDYYLKDKGKEQLKLIKDEIYKFGKQCKIDYIGERTTLDQQRIEDEEKFKNM